MAELKGNFGVHWFRRDLRVIGNRALLLNSEKHRGRTLGVFFFDSKFLSRSDFSHNRFGFFLETLKALKAELQDLGGGLLVIDSPPRQGFELLLAKLKSRRPSLVTFNRDYEPFARERDSNILRYLSDQEVETATDGDHLIFEPHEITRVDGERAYYQVFTSFFNRWSAKLSSEEGLTRLLEQRRAWSAKPWFSLSWSDVLPQSAIHDALDAFARANKPRVTVPMPKAGSNAAFSTLVAFETQLNHYKVERDFPATKGTSQLSIYFKNGSITPSMVLAHLKYDSAHSNESRLQFLKEIGWREFYYHLLYHCPNIEHEAFLPQFRNLRWETNEAYFEAWKNGRTGFPIVDAGMRQLKETGRMHNRVRMIVASFLTKDLLIDWRWGERHFMHQLLDGDLAPNNGGWQWAASTGCDAQPYFRIFNPALQAKKFDPDGSYVRKWVPELVKGNYIAPIVNHAEQRVRALQLYRRSRP